MSTSDSSFFVDLLLKATPSEEAGERVIYCEASNETVDFQREVVLQTALADSMEYMLAKGNFDIDHVTMTGAKAGIPDYLLYEIGHPTDVSFRDGRTFVKGIIFKGEGRAAERANQFWSSLTDISPPARWFPSVGGHIMARDVSIDPLTKSRVVKVSKVLWNNIGFSKNPINHHVNTAQTVPLDVFSKCFRPDGCLDLRKALEAGYGTDSATLTDGAALRTQSLDTQVQATLPAFTPEAAREAMARRLHPRALAEFLMKTYGLPESEALDHARSFLRDTLTRTGASHV